MATIIYYKRCFFNFELNNINIDKMNKSINKFAYNNNLLKLFEKKKILIMMY